MQINLQKSSPSLDRHRTQSGGPNIEPNQHLSAPYKARQSMHNKSRPLPRDGSGMRRAPLVQISQKAQPVLNFDPDPVATLKRCISNEDHGKPSATTKVYPPTDLSRHSLNLLSSLHNQSLPAVGFRVADTGVAEVEVPAVLTHDE